MRRIALLLTVAAMMMVVMAAGALPAVAAGSGGVVTITPLNNNLTVLPPNPIRGPITVAHPTDPIAPVLAHNPNVVSGGCGLDVCPTP